MGRLVVFCPLALVMLERSRVLRLHFAVMHLVMAHLTHHWTLYSGQGWIIREEKRAPE